MRFEIDLSLHRIQQFHVDFNFTMYMGRSKLRRSSKEKIRRKTDKEVVKQTLIILIVLFPRARPTNNILTIQYVIHTCALPVIKYT